ncbi:hypothetical protein ZOSMA_123G00030 [Zostera marina]|uniref:RRM domain-containing protein n=1 Tax=Zostera marina TaxID=29655 RepID=A0A0K9Q2J9_ZOSMR|nr:hypothetical protein ZOSMA_123G00030 [Zostera marina]
MGTVDCDHEINDLNNLDLEPKITITIGDKVESDQVKDVVVSDRGSLSTNKESNEEMKKRNLDKEKVNQKADVSITVLPISKLNPLAEEFVPQRIIRWNFGKVVVSNVAGSSTSVGLSDHRRRTNSRTSLAQHKERIKMTIYVCDIDLHISEDYLASMFSKCGPVVDCRICIDPSSIRRIAFIEFTDEVGTAAALAMSGTIVAQLKLLGDGKFPTRIAFIEFVMAESAVAALNCSGVMLGHCSIRISPSKTPIWIPVVRRSNRN